MHFQLFSWRHCRSLRWFSANQFNGTIPPQLGNLTMLQQLYARAPLIFLVIPDLTLHLLIPLFIVAFSGDLLNALNWHFFLLFSDLTLRSQSGSWCIFNWSHCLIVALSGTSTRISSLAPSHQSSATFRRWASCTQIRVALHWHLVLSRGRLLRTVFQPKAWGHQLLP